MTIRLYIYIYNRRQPPQSSMESQGLDLEGLFTLHPNASWQPGKQLQHQQSDSQTDRQTDLKTCILSAEAMTHNLFSAMTHLQQTVIESAPAVRS